MKWNHHCEASWYNTYASLNHLQMNWHWKSSKHTLLILKIGTLVTIWRKMVLQRCFYQKSKPSNCSKSKKTTTWKRCCQQQTTKKKQQKNDKQATTTI